MSSSSLSQSPAPSALSNPPSITKVYTRRCHNKNTALPSIPPTPTFVHTMQIQSKSKALTNPPQVFLSSSYPMKNIDMEPNTFNQAVKHEH
jgi:hypothetical protein